MTVKKMQLRAAGVFMILIMTLMSFTGCTEKREVLRVYNYGDYIDDSLKDKFMEETGIELIYETFDTNEAMYSKLKPGGVKYDVLIPSDYMIRRLLREDRLQKIDISKITSFDELNPDLLNKSFDPDQEYSVPYFWGTLGIAYNKTMVNKPVESLDILWDKDFNRNVFMIDSMRDGMGIALKKLGYSMNSVNPDEITAAKEELIRQKTDGIFLALSLDDVKDKMVAGEAALAVCYSGEGIYMEDESDDLVYTIPEEGTNVWFDCMVIPKDAQNVDGAHKFIDFMNKYENASVNAEYTGYSTPNIKVWEKLPDKVRNNTTMYPDAEYIEKCEQFEDMSDEVIKMYDDAWVEYKVAE